MKTRLLLLIVCLISNFDLTAQVPYMVKDIRSGAIGGFEYLYSGTTYNNIDFKVVWEKNGEIYFVAISSSSSVSGVISNNRELWKSDGTANGTVMVKDINPGVEGSVPTDFFEFNNELYFTADNGTSGRELWKTDGTSAGTVQVKEIRSGAIGGFEYQSSGNDFYTLSFTPVWVNNGEFYFIAINASSDVGGVIKNNRELWKSNGTDAGTVMVKDIWTGTDGSNPSGFYPWNGNLYFAAENSTNGRELWKTDGTNAGTVLVKDIRSGAIGGFEYLSSGTSYGSIPFNPVWEHNGEFYFLANNASSDVGGVVKNNRELWKSNGTDAGTVMVKDIWAGTDGSYPSGFYPWNGLLYFAANNGTNGRELWKTDGTNSGTVMVKEIRSGAIGGFEYLSSGINYGDTPFAPVWEHNGEFFFVAINASSDVGGVVKNNRELWKSNGTDAGTVMVKDIWTGTDGSNPSGFYPWNGNLYFAAENNTNGRELWKSDGTNAGTVLVKDIRSGTIGGFEYLSSGTTYNSISFTPVWENNGEFYFVAINASSNTGGVVKNNRELWKSNGTDAGTVMVKDIWTGTDGSNPSGFYPWNGNLYFAAENNTNGRELWKSDGTNAGTELVKDIRSGAIGGFEYLSSGTTYNNLTFVPVASSGSEFYFIAINASSDVGGVVNNNRELWKTNGTNAGTVMVADICPGTTGSNPDDFYPAATKLYFAADNCTNGRELWAIDGAFTEIPEVADVLVKIFPNPAKEQFTVSTTAEQPEKIKYIITDIRGSVVGSGMLTGANTTVDTKSLSPGMFVVQLLQDGRVPVTKKLMIQQ